MQSFKTFLESFLGALAAPDFCTAGALPDYLNLPESERGGDEMPIVDNRITESLLAALGYAKSEWKYNQNNADGRPDFVVSIPEYPEPACFVVEDKNTTTPKLTEHRHQLLGYMIRCSAPRGLLVNGVAMIAYDHADLWSNTPTFEVPLGLAVETWLGRNLLGGGARGIEALDRAGLLPALAALWRRYGREGFASLTTLIADLTLQRDGAPHECDGASWKPERCRIPLQSVSQNPQALTEAVKGLIAEFEDDVDAQLAAFEQDYQEFMTLAAGQPNQPSFAEQEEQLLVKLRALMPPSLSEWERRSLEMEVRAIMARQLPLKNLEILESLRKLHRIKSENGSDPIKTLAYRIRMLVVARILNLEKLKVTHGEAQRVMDCFETWKEKTASLVFQSGDPQRLRREFVTQTAYLVVVRMLLVRIMEDKGLMPRAFTNGGLALWFQQVEPQYLALAAGRSAHYLLALSYESAQRVYAHFYQEKTVLDWYRPERTAVVRVLHRLAGFDLRDIDRDIIGTVYNQYVAERHKHESGMYFTPPPVVEFMLDRIGYRGRGILERKLLDLSCGSGTFLVAAARRLLAAHRDYWQAQGHPDIPIEQAEHVIKDLRDALHGIDLNPFACALAEINLLIQVMDLINAGLKTGVPVHVERFHIYSDDSLSFTLATNSVLADGLSFPVEVLPVTDQIKAAIGEWSGGFDFVVGNPPYVRADENDEWLRAYRERVRREHPIRSVQEVMTLKWDLFIPFVAQSAAVLKDGGTMCLITSSAIEKAPYAEALRQQLLTMTRLREVHFFPNLRLFVDAAVENTIFMAEKGAAQPDQGVTRYWHDRLPAAGNRVERQTLPSSYGDDVFRQALPTLKLKKNVKYARLVDLCYLSVGMVLNSSEKKNKGAFSLDDLIRDAPDPVHCVPYVGSKDISDYGIIKLAYLEYGPATRVPAQIRRPTFPELYDRPKLMAAEFGGFAYDDGQWDSRGFLKCNHSVFILMPWHGLSRVNNQSILSDLRNRNRAALNLLSSTVDSWYLLGFLNSRPMRELLAGVSRSAIADRLQPNDLREILVPLPSQTLSDDIAQLAREAMDCQRALLPYRRNGWKINGKGIAPPFTVPAGIATRELGRAKVRWGVYIITPGAKLVRLERRERRIMAGRAVAIEADPSVSEEALDWLTEQLRQSGLYDLQVAEKTGLQVPATPQDAEQAWKQLQGEKMKINALLDRIAAIKEDIAMRLEGLFERLPHPAKASEVL